jgi:zinc protease
MNNPTPLENTQIPQGMSLDARAPFGSGGKEVFRYQLDNGLTLLFLEDQSAPVFTYQTWYRVGSSYEEAKKTGLAHFFEHLMFKGTKKHPEGTFDRMMEERGAQTNAGTWLDWTFYYENLPAGMVPGPEGQEVDRGIENLNLVAGFEADRMQHLQVEEGPFLSELEVVKNERMLRVDNDPEGKMDEVLWSIAFKEHPYHWPTIGWMEDLNEMKLENARAFYKSFYAPNRAVIVIAGALDHQSVLNAISSQFGPIDAQDIKRPERVVEPVQTEERRTELQLQLATERAILGYKIPGIADPDMPTMDVLCEILFNSNSARAERALVQKSEIALDVGGWVGSFEDPSLFLVTLNCQSGNKAEEAIDQLDEVISELLTHGVHAHEVERARNKIRMSLLRSMLAAHSRAYQLGFYETTVGDFQALFKFMESLDAITPNDVLEVARKYLCTERRSIVIGRPEEAAAGGVHAAGAAPAALHRAPEMAAGSPLPDAPTDLEGLRGSQFNIGPITTFVVPDHDVPYVSFMVQLHQGSQHDPEGLEGLASITGDMLLRGTEKYNREELAAELDGLGSSLNVRVRKGVTTLVGDVASDHLERYLELVGEVLWNPRFDTEELEKLKRQTLGEIESIQEDDAALARRGFARRLYENHPWQRSTIGELDTIPRIDPSSVRGFYKDHLSNARMVIGCSGDVTPERLEGLVRANFPDPIPSGGAEELTVGTTDALPGLCVVLVDKPERSQTQVIMGHTTIEAKHPDLTAMSVGNTAFGGTFTSKLMQEVRVKRGWSYGAYSSVSVGRELSTYNLAFYPKTEDTIPAIRLVLGMLDELKEHGLKEEEVNFSKSYRQNAFPFGLETHPKRLRLLVNAHYMDRPKDWIMGHNRRIASVRTEDVASAFEQHIDPSKMVIAITCTAEHIIEGIKELPGLSELWVQPYDQPWKPYAVPFDNFDD